MSAFEDLTGQKFNRLTVISRAESTGKQTAWNCLCDCGNHIIVTGNKLKRGHTKSCGCLKHDRCFKDLTGQQYGELTVIGFADDYISPKGKHMRQWKCLCSCGETIITTENRLKAGRVKSCGHPEDLTGRRYGSLVVLCRADDLIESNGRHRTVWHCLCDCGQECDITSHALKSGNTTSCGCVKQQMYKDMKVDITGVRQANGYLVGIREIEPRYSKGGMKKSIWLCKCLRCGKEVEVSLNHFATGNKKSCGCIKRSYGEALVKDYMVFHGLDFKTEVMFDDLIGEEGRPYRYDFGLYRNGELYTLIEYNGKQHYKPSWSSKDKSAIARYNEQKEHDVIKREYARKMGIPLIEIPYTLNKYSDIEEYLNKNLNGFSA